MKVRSSGLARLGALRSDPTTVKGDRTRMLNTFNLTGKEGMTVGWVPPECDFVSRRNTIRRFAFLHRTIEHAGDLSMGLRD
jgi:hypothetical protein